MAYNRERLEQFNKILLPNAQRELNQAEKALEKAQAKSDKLFNEAYKLQHQAIEEELESRGLAVCFLASGGISTPGHNISLLLTIWANRPKTVDIERLSEIGVFPKDETALLYIKNSDPLMSGRFNTDFYLSGLKDLVALAAMDGGSAGRIYRLCRAHLPEKDLLTKYAGHIAGGEVINPNCVEEIIQDGENFYTKDGHLFNKQIDKIREEKAKQGNSNPIEKPHIYYGAYSSDLIGFLGIPKLPSNPDWE